MVGEEVMGQAGGDVASMVNDYQFGGICLPLSSAHKAGQSDYSGSGCVLKPACLG